jgi:hypothetical protein
MSGTAKKLPLLLKEKEALGKIRNICMYDCECEEKTKFHERAENRSTYVNQAIHFVFAQDLN